jgi:hypothetical protein
MNSNIPLDEIVQVNVTRVPSGLETPNVNNVVIFSHECPPDFEDVRHYINISQVIEDFGADTTTTELARALFSQTPNPISAGAKLSIVKSLTIDATPAVWTSPDISDNVENFAAVNNGRFAITRTSTGAVTQIGPIDFTGADDLEDVCNAIIDAMPEAYVAELDEDTITISSQEEGEETVFTLGAPQAGTDITTANFLNVAAADPTEDGTDEAGEPLATAVERASHLTFFTGFISTEIMATDDILKCAQDIQPLDKIWLCPIYNQDGIDVAIEVKNAALSNTRMLYYSTNVTDAQRFAAAYLGRAFSVNFSGSNTVQSMFLKELVSILPDPEMSQDLLANLKAAGVDAYCSFGGAPRTYTSGANKHFDQVYNTLAIKIELQYDVFNVLATSITKLPQTEPAMEQLKSVIASLMNKFVRNGFIAPGTWNSAFTFGDPSTFRNNISQMGYYIYSLPISEQSQSDREKRIAPLIQCACKEAGAIHNIIINVSIEA